MKKLDPRLEETLKEEQQTEEIVLTSKKLEKEPKENVPWSKVITLSATPEDVAEQLKKRELHTYADVMARPNEVISALQEAYALDLATILRLAREHQDKLK